MGRNFNTTQSGRQWSPDTKFIIWSKGTEIQNYPGNVWRHDKCGQVMKWEEYGNRNSDHGWEIDHINPVVNGGSDGLSNLQALNWKNNATKGDKLNWKCGQ